MSTAISRIFPPFTWNLNLYSCWTARRRRVVVVVQLLLCTVCVCVIWRKIRSGRWNSNPGEFGEKHSRSRAPAFQVLASFIMMVKSAANAAASCSTCRRTSAAKNQARMPNCKKTLPKRHWSRLNHSHFYVESVNVMNFIAAFVPLYCYRYFCWHCWQLI